MTPTAISREFLQARVTVLSRAAQEVQGLEGNWTREQRAALRKAAHRLRLLRQESVRALAALRRADPEGLL